MYQGIPGITGTLRFVCFRIRGKRLRTENKKKYLAVTGTGFLELPRAPPQYDAAFKLKTIFYSLSDVDQPFSQSDLPLG